MAERKALSLIEAGAKVKVIAPKITEGLAELATKGRIEHLAREYRAGDACGMRLMIGATNDRGVNKAVFDEAKERGLLINVVDEVELSDFILPSTLKRGDLLIAVSTSGAAPAFAKKIKDDLELLFDQSYAGYLDILKEARGEIKAKYHDQAARAKAWERIVAIDISELLNQGNLEELKELVKKCI